MIKKYKYYWLIGLLVFQFMELGAQILREDTVDMERRYKWVEYTHDLDFYEMKRVDTAISRLHYYNPADQGDNAYHFLGNLGTQHTPLTFQYQNETVFDMGYHSLDAYQFTMDNARFFWSKSPFTEAFYGNGTKVEQLVKVTHAQNLKNKVNFTFDYRRITSPGFYLRQHAKIHNLNFHTWYRSKNERYNAILGFLWNDNQLQENGGIENSFEETFADTTVSRKELLRVNLDNADWRQSERRLFMHQSYEGGFDYQTVVNDSTSVSKFSPVWRANHYWNYTNYNYDYTDSSVDTDYYSHIWIDSTNTGDSIKRRDFETGVGIMLLGKNFFKKDTTDKGYRLKLGLDYHTIALRGKNVGAEGGIAQFNYFERYHNARITFNFYNALSLQQKVRYHLKAQLGVLGYNVGDYWVHGQLAFRTKLGMLNASIDNSLKEASFIQRFYFSNHHRWSNDFKKTFNLNYRVSYTAPKDWVKLEYVGFILKNYILINEQIEPEQLSDALTVQQLKLSAKFEGKRWGMEHQLIAQLSDHDKIKLPLYAGTHNIYYRGWWFKRALQVQTGLLMHYNTDYHIPGFSPSMSSFFVNSDQRFAFYPVFDVYLNVQIDRARIFFRTKHLSQGIFKNKGYFTAVQYPMYDRSFNFGVSWRFFD